MKNITKELFTDFIQDDGLEIKLFVVVDSLVGFFKIYLL